MNPETMKPSRGIIGLMEEVGVVMIYIVLRQIGILGNGEIAPRDRWPVFQKFNFKLTDWNAEHIFP